MKFTHQLMAALLSAVLLFPNHTVAATFEEMLSGFDRCEFKDVYVDIFSKKPVHAYFTERNLEPTRIEKDMAFFHLRERFFELPVYKLMIPAGTFDVHAIYIDLPIERARQIVKMKFGTEFIRGKLSDAGEQPMLVTDPAHPNKSILTCNPRSE